MKRHHDPKARPLTIEPLEDRRLLTITVDTLTDELDGNLNDDISLRDAIAAASSGETINFSSSLDDGTITLDRVNLGEIYFAWSLTIDASSLNSLTIDADDPTPGRTEDGIRIFNIDDLTAGASPPLVTFKGLTLTGADTIDEGGAIRSKARLVIRDSIIVNNEAKLGGGIFVEVAGGGVASREVLRIQNSIIDDNDADTGGGVYVRSGNSDTPTTDSILISNTVISDNKVSSNGGGVYVTSGNSNTPTTDSILISNTVISDNKASSNGGGVYVDLYGAILTMNNGSTLILNEANRGGGLYAQAGSGSIFALDQSTIEENEANNSGAGAYVVARSGSLQLDDGRFLNNESSSSAGGLFLRVETGASALVTRSSFEGNVASPAFSGFTGGGGMLAQLERDAVLAVVDSEFIGNIAPEGGGIQLLMPSSPTHSNANDSVFTLQRSVVKSNRATNRGGGIYAAVGWGGEMIVDESIITDNDAGLLVSGTGGYGELPASGGGVYAYLFSNNEAAVLTITSSEISANTAGKHGGGLAVCTKRQSSSAAVSRLDVTNTTISGNSAGNTTAGNIEPGTGGGVHLAIYPFESEEALDAHFASSTVTGNTADTGGGVYSFVPYDADQRNNVQLTNTIVSGNAKHNGNPNNFWGSINAAQTRYSLISDGSATGPDNRFVDHATHLDIAFASLGDGNANNNGINDPGLSSLGFHGGLTRTHVPLPVVDSPVINQGDPNAVAGVGGIPEFDQRGDPVSRVIGGRIDIGAVERDTVGLAPPKVANVVISGSNSTHDPFSMDQVAGSGTQIKTVPVGGADTIAIQFTEDVPVTEDMLVLAGMRTGALPELVVGGFAYDPDTLTATWHFADLVANDMFVISLSDAAADVEGHLLDGEWTNPASTLTTNGAVSEFPSGDNVAGGDFKFVVTMLGGDSNLDGTVDFVDWLAIVDVVYISPTTMLGATFVQSDFTGDGLVNEDDVDWVVNNALVNLQSLLLTGDLNGDGAVDQDDLDTLDLLLEWTIGEDASFLGVLYAALEADGDGIIDQATLTLMFDHLYAQFGLDFVG